MGNFCCNSVVDKPFSLGSVDSFLRDAQLGLYKRKIKGRAEKFAFSKSWFFRIIDANLSEIYEIGNCIGKGKHGCVYKGIHKSTSIPRAIKTLKKQKDTGYIMKEVEILSQLDHPNIINLVEIIQEPQEFHIITELCAGGELFNKIVASHRLSENQAAKYMMDIISAVMYSHDNGIVHRDIKPENILLDREGDYPTLKLIDFGCGAMIQPGKKLSELIGTPFYVAPEVIMKEYDEKCDIWSCGVVMYILLCGYPPFAGSNRSEVLRNVLKADVKFRGPEWKLVSPEAKDLISRMLIKNPNKRPSARDVFRHPWIQMRGLYLLKDKSLNLSTLNNLTRFCAGCKLQLASLTYLAYRLSSNRETTDLEKLFKTLDLNGDGKLSKEELNVAFSIFQGNDSIDIDRIIQRCDSNKNGYIDFTEFLTASINWEQALSGERLDALFKELDKDNDGTITIKEIKIFLGGSGYIEEQEWEEIFQEADVDSNGIIDLQEFRTVMLTEFKDMLL